MLASTQIWDDKQVPSGPSAGVRRPAPPYGDHINPEHQTEATVAIAEAPTTETGPVSSAPVVALKRRTVDSVLIGIGAVLTVAFFVAGSLLMWGANFSEDYVHDELASQNISFPSAQALEQGGRSDLVKYADQAVDTGAEAEAYASYINGHLADVADGATYADLGTPERQAQAAVKDAQANGADAATVAELQAKSEGITAQRDTLFKGETLRGLLLSAYAWSTVGMIAFWSAIAAFAAGVVTLVLVLLGLRHHHKVVLQEG
jgi:hypothetical protein